MGLHERAWAGLEIMVFGKTPLLPMQIEQAIAAATPANEVKIESYEEYADALDYCKDRRTVGFFVLLENCGEYPVHDVFKQLSKPYEQKGWPCFGILVHEGQESFVGLRTLQRSPNILGYHSSKDFLDKTKTPSLMNDIWNAFSAAFEKHLVPNALQETFTSLAVETTPIDSIHFQDRVTTMLSHRLNVSWIETVALRWAPSIDAIQAKHPSALSPHVALTQICSLTQFKGDRAKYETIVASKEALVARIRAAAEFLDSKRLSGELEGVLQTLGALSRPGAPAMLRHTSNLKTEILQAAHSVNEERKAVGQ